MKRLVIVVGVAVLSATAVGCSSKNPSPVSAAAAKALKPLVKDLRAAADGESVFAVRQAEQALNNEVDQLVQSQDLTPNRGQNIQDAAATLLSDFRHKIDATASPTESLTPTETPTTETPTPTETVTPSSTVTVTVPPTETPTDTATATATATSTSTKTNHGHGGGFGGGGLP
jgi:hypothetical protein